MSGTDRPFRSQLVAYLADRRSAHEALLASRTCQRMHLRSRDSTSSSGRTHMSAATTCAPCFAQRT